jgi:hypothetical protein
MNFVWVMFAMCAFCALFGVYQAAKNQKEDQLRDKRRQEQERLNRYHP